MTKKDILRLLKGAPNETEIVISRYDDTEGTYLRRLEQSTKPRVYVDGKPMLVLLSGDVITFQEWETQ